MNNQQKLREEQFQEQSRRTGDGYGFIYQNEIVEKKMEEKIKAWAIISDDGGIVPYNFPVEGNTLLAGIFVKKEDAERWLKKAQGQFGFKGSVISVIIHKNLENK